MEDPPSEQAFQTTGRRVGALWMVHLLSSDAGGRA